MDPLRPTDPKIRPLPPRQLSEPEDPPPFRPQPPLAPLAPRPLTPRPLAPLAPRPLGDPAAARPPADRPPAPRPVRAVGPVYRGLPVVVRVALWVAAAVVIGGIIGATAPTALRRIGATAALQPGILAWYSARALGFLAYLVVAGSVLYGLLLSTKILDAIAHRPVSFALHKDLSIVGLLLATLHATVLLADQSYPFTPRAILVPFESPYSPIAVGIGQLTIYGLAVIAASFYVRRQIGQRAWRLLHYLTFLVFVGAIGHGITSGSDSGSSWAFWLYLVPGAAAVFLLVYRIFVSIAGRLSRSEPERPAPVSPLIARAPLPLGANRVPLAAGRAPASFDPPVAGPPFD